MRLFLRALLGNRASSASVSRSFGFSLAVPLTARDLSHAFLSGLYLFAS